MPLRVRYVECDMQGRVFNGHYLTWVDMALNEAIRDIFGDYQVLTGNPVIGWTIVDWDGITSF